MNVKRWVYSGEDEDLVKQSDLYKNAISYKLDLEQVLGIKWDPRRDMFWFFVCIYLHPMKNKI